MCILFKKIIYYFKYYLRKLDLHGIPDINVLFCCVYNIKSNYIRLRRRQPYRRQITLPDQNGELYQFLRYVDLKKCVMTHLMLFNFTLTQKMLQNYFSLLNFQP